jgi:hypothetical protein
MSGRHTTEIPAKRLHAAVKGNTVVSKGILWYQRNAPNSTLGKYDDNSHKGERKLGIVSFIVFS